MCVCVVCEHFDDDRENHPVLVDDLLHKTLENPSWEKTLGTNRRRGAAPDKENVRRNMPKHHAQHTHHWDTTPHTNTGALASWLPPVSSRTHVKTDSLRGSVVVVDW